MRYVRPLQNSFVVEELPLHGDLEFSSSSLWGLASGNQFTAQTTTALLDYTAISSVL